MSLGSMYTEFVIQMPVLSNIYFVALTKENTKQNGICYNEEVWRHESYK